MDSGYGNIEDLALVKDIERELGTDIDNSLGLHHFEAF